LKLTSLIPVKCGVRDEVTTQGRECDNALGCGISGELTGQCYRAQKSKHPKSLPH